LNVLEITECEKKGRLNVRYGTFDDAAAIREINDSLPCLEKMTCQSRENMRLPIANSSIYEDLLVRVDAEGIDARQYLSELYPPHIRECVVFGDGETVGWFLHGDKGKR
jgi:hypothetical protein